MLDFMKYQEYIPGIAQDDIGLDGYIENKEQVRQIYYFRRDIYREIFQRFPEDGHLINCARAMVNFLDKKPMIMNDSILAGYLQNTDITYSSAKDVLVEYDAILKRADRKITEEERALLEEYIRLTSCGMYARRPGGHVIAGYETLLKNGINGMLEKVHRLEKVCNRTPGDLIEAAQILLPAFSRYILRYADEAENELDRTEDPRIFEDLARMAESCRWISENPPRNFFDAVQLLILTHEVIFYEQQNGALSIGPIDRYLDSFYVRDCQAGVLTPDEAERILTSLWKKFALVPFTFQNVTIGGAGGDGRFFDSDITRIALRLNDKLRKDQPLLSLRCTKDMPQDVWELALQSISSGLGFPSLHNDEICRKALASANIPYEETLDFGIIGCVEMTVPSKEYALTEELRINWAKVLELMMHNGTCPVSGETFVSEYFRDGSEYRNFEEVEQAYIDLLNYFTEKGIRATNLLDIYYPENWPYPFLSLTMEGCLEKNQDVTAGGTVYNNSSINGSGMANAVDSLLALKRYVYEEKRVTWAEFCEILKNDFKDHETFRDEVYKNCTRFGSEPEASLLMHRITEAAGEEVRKCKNTRGGVWRMGLYSVAWHPILGARTGSLPDGRLRGISIANGLSPVQGTEKYGPTAVLNAVLEVDHSRLSNGMVLDLKFNGSFLKSAAHRRALQTAIEVYFEQGGMEVQLNMVDQKTLTDAQKNPDQYKNLIVRVSGFSAYFVTLPRNLQDEIICRSQFQ